MRSSWRRLAPLLSWLLALFIAVAAAPAKSASREKFFDTLEYQGVVASQLVEASGESCFYAYDFASGDSFYNYFRDYNPTTGRYQQSDPIGLLAGINTYTYVAANPLGFYDPAGLCSIRKRDYPTRTTKKRYKEIENLFDGNCLICKKPLSGKKTVQHSPSVVDTHNALGWNTDQPTRNSLYDQTATGFACGGCQASEGGSTTTTYRKDTGPNYKPRGRR